VFSIIANNYGIAGQVIEDTMDALAVRLAEFRR
jgi:RNase P/RNase MRP subunit p29